MFGREMKADLQINQMLSSYSLPNDQEMACFSFLLLARHSASILFLKLNISLLTAINRQVDHFLEINFSFICG